MVSGAAGAVRKIAGQIGKIYGCKVIGMVGGDQKANLNFHEFGMDAAISYREHADMDATLTQLYPEGGKRTTG